MHMTHLAAPVGHSVEIVRDRAGVPHIYATTTADLYFGLGFAMAHDRLWQMDRLRRRALGRQAEILGARYVQADLMHHAVGIPEIAERETECIDDATRDLVQRFVEGINRQIEQSSGQLPPEFGMLDYAPEPFTVRDVIAILRGEWWSLNGRLQNLAIAEAAQFLPEHLRSAYLLPEAAEERIVGGAVEHQAQPAGGAGMGDGTGSNNWAVAPARTVSGHALLCGDPHQPFWVPSSWYEYALHGPEDTAAGAGHPGVPGLWWGTNGDIAWSITNNAASTRDLYRELVHPQNPDLYRDGDMWRPFDRRTLEIRVRGAEPVRHEQRATVRGPIVNHLLPRMAEAGDPPLALRWVGHEHLDDVRAAVAVGRARDWDAFRAALRDWSVAVFNFVYADRRGHIGYQCAGRIPLRGRQVSGYRDANDPADTWQGYVPFDGLPRLFNPAIGYVASANQRVSPDDYPYPLDGAWAGGHRGRRIRQAFAATPAVDASWAVKLQNDVKSTRAERLCPRLLELLADSAQPDVQALRDVLADWDYAYTLDSAAPTVFETFMQAWQERVARERFPAHLVQLVQTHNGAAAYLLEHPDLAWFPGAGSDTRSQVVAAAVESMARIRARHGQDPSGWTWGTVHRAHWQHPLSGLDGAAGGPALDIGPASVDGGSDTLRNTGAGDPPFAASSGAEYRMVVDFAEPERFLAVQNIGNSGVPGSPHYADQFQTWLAGGYHVVSLNRADLERDAESTTVLAPTT